MSSLSPNFTKPIQLPLSKSDLDTINIYLSSLSPQDILKWAIEYLPGLYQTTAFGLTGLVTIDMISKFTTTTTNTTTSSPPPLIFIDTLYHFPETYELVEEVKSKYQAQIYIYKPDGCSSTKDFEEKYGATFWERDEDSYDFCVKVEPAQRAYKELSVQSVITGRRASQGGDRASLQPLEIDSTGLVKLNPLVSWTFSSVQSYIEENHVPRNRLLSQGYRSVGDWHSTSKVEEGQDERAGRWAGKEKTECGLHQDYFKMRAQAEGVTST